MERESSKSSSTIWSLFTKKDNFYATCNACHNDYSYKTSITNLRKHWDHKHRDLADIIQDSNSDYSDGEQETTLLKIKNPTWKYFEVLDSDKFEATCKLCGDNISYESVSDLTKHVRNHGEQTKDTDDDDDDMYKDTEVKTRRRNSIMWQYFSIVDKKSKSAVCIFCKRILSFSSFNNLKRHLVKKHPQVKNIVVSSNGKLYEVDNGTSLIEDDEKDPIEMDTIYLEDIDDTIDQNDTPQITIKSPKKKENKPLKRHFSQRVKEPVKNSNDRYYDEPLPKRNSNDHCYYEPLPKKNSNDHCYYEPLPKQNKPNAMGILDYFGEYVVNLLKEMPKSAAEQLQKEIIINILEKKAALQPQTSNKSTITVSDSHPCNPDEIDTEPATVTICGSHDVSEDHVNGDDLVSEGIDNITET